MGEGSCSGSQLGVVGVLILESVRPPRFGDESDLQGEKGTRPSDMAFIYVMIMGDEVVSGWCDRCFFPLLKTIEQRQSGVSGDTDNSHTTDTQLI